MMPKLSMEQIASARYILFNPEYGQLTYPLRLKVFKSRVDIWLTDFYTHMREEYPSLEYEPVNNEKGNLVIHDDFDIIKFLLLYGD